MMDVQIGKYYKLVGKDYIALIEDLTPEIIFGQVWKNGKVFAKSKDRWYQTGVWCGVCVDQLSFQIPLLEVDKNGKPIDNKPEVVHNKLSNIWEL